jgi:hypothetical protein
MTTFGMKKSEMSSEAILEATSEVITKVISEMTCELNEFDRRVKLLIDCGAMKDKDWRNQDVKKRTKCFLKLWEKTQKGMTYTTFLISYVQLKEDRKGTREKVLKVAKQGDINTFTVIKSHENHYAIIDEEHDILEYRYRIKPELLRMLEETTAALPRMGVNAGNRGNYPIRHYTVWRDYKMELYESSEYRKQLPASKE